MHATLRIDFDDQAVDLLREIAGRSGVEHRGDERDRLGDP